MDTDAGLGDVLAWLEGAPDGTLVPASAVAERLRALSVAMLANRDAPPSHEPDVPASETWRERLWTVPADTRLGVREVAEALGKSRDAVYRLTSAGTIPHRKRGAELVFVASEVREWLADEEEIVVEPRPFAERLRVVGRE